MAAALRNLIFVGSRRAPLSPGLARRSLSTVSIDYRGCAGLADVLFITCYGISLYTFYKNQKHMYDSSEDRKRLLEEFKLRLQRLAKDA